MKRPTSTYGLYADGIQNGPMTVICRLRAGSVRGASRRCID